MGFKHPNHRLVKIHRTYTVEEVAKLFDIHRNTVRGWLRNGLAMIDQHRPQLILGHAIVDFLKARRARNKRTCRPGEIYCMRCREPRWPVDHRAVCRTLTSTTGNLIGICPICSARMFRRVNLAKLSMAAGDLLVSIPEAQQHIGGSHQPSVNCDFRQDSADHD